MIVRTPDERDEYIATQKATVERIIIREANRIEGKLYPNAEEFLASLDELQDEVPC
jgi:hypothetical protein